MKLSKFCKGKGKEIGIFIMICDEKLGYEGKEIDYSVLGIENCR